MFHLPKSQAVSCSWAHVIPAASWIYSCSDLWWITPRREPR